jgi:hypothetical protein
MRRKLPATVALLSLWLAPAAAAQGDPRLTRLDPRTREEVARVIDSLAHAGVPVEPLVDKALEGQTKGAPGPRIVAAVRAWGVDLAATRGALGPSAEAPEVVAGASALRAGVTLAALHDLALARGDQDLLVPLAVITELTAAGVPPMDAADAVIQVARSGGSDADFRAIQQSGGRGHGRPATAGQGPGSGHRDPRPPRTVPNKKGRIPGQGNGNGNGNGNGHGNSTLHP